MLNHWWRWWSVKWCNSFTDGWYSKGVALLQWQQLRAWRLLFSHFIIRPPAQMSTFHLLIWQEWLSEGRTLEKAKLHTGSHKQERICLAKWPGPQSPKHDSAQTEALQICSTAQKGVSCRLLQWQWNTQIWLNNTVKASGAMSKGLEKAFF